MSKFINSSLLVTTSLKVFGGLPSSTCIGISIGLFANNSSLRINSCSLVASPKTAYGARSRLAILSKVSRSFSATASTYLSCDSLHQISSGDICLSSFGISLSSNFPPFPESFTSSGNPFDSPPAPISWIDTIGLFSPRFVQASITSCARLCISGLAR